MKNYKEEVKAIRKEWIQSRIKRIEESLRDLKPWNYVICKDRIPRIGRELVVCLNIQELQNLSVPEIVTHFRNKGFIIEQNNNSSIIYLKNDFSKEDTLYKAVTENLANYAYVEWPSNWPKAVNDILTQNGIKVYNQPEDIQLLYEFIKNKAFENISIKIREMTRLYVFAFERNVKLGVSSLENDAEKIVENFFFNQGFGLKRKRKTLIMPLENKNQSGIVKYCYECIYDNIATNLLADVQHISDVNVERLFMQMNDYLPEDVKNMLKADGFVLRQGDYDSLIISLL